MIDRDIGKQPQPLEDKALDEASGGLPAVQIPQSSGGVRSGDGSVKPIIGAILGDGSVRPIG